MRRATVLLALLAVAASEGSCPGGGSGGRATYLPCEGKACGERCTVCPPWPADCFETADVKSCDVFGQCMGGTTDCAPPTAPCAAKRCGVECTIDPPCRDLVPACLLPSRLGHCDRSGGCVEGASPLPPGSCAPPLPDWGCRGKACGDSCGFCPPDADWSTCPFPTFAPTACDAQLACTTVGTFTCGP